jgi:IPT/TIG domain
MARSIPGGIPRLLAAAALAFGVACSKSSHEAAGPKITAVTPATGTISTIVTLTGTGFAQGTGGVNPTVTFTPSAGGTAVPAQVVRFTSDTSLDVRVPAVDPAADGTQLDIKVENPGGGSGTAAKAFTMKAPTITSVNGGLVGSGTPNSAFIVVGTNYGDLDAAPASGYSVDFRDAAGTVVATATVDFAVGDWKNVYVLGVVPGTLSTGTTYQLTVTTPSGTSAPRSFLVQAAVSFSPSTIGWTQTASLPAPLQGLAAAVAALNVQTSPPTLLYALGGNSASATDTAGKAANVTTVSFDTFDPATGLLANPAWTTTTALPDKRGFASAVFANAWNSVVPGNGNLYVIGGLDGTGAATSTVYTAAVNADGTIPAAGAAGTWKATTALPQPLYAAAAAIFQGRIYVVGGNDATNAPVAKVYVSQIQGDGTLDAWTALPDLPAALAYHQLVVSAASLYVLGGDTAAADPLSNVWSPSEQSGIAYAPLDIRNGGMVNPAWTPNASALTKAREKFTAVAAGPYVLVSGGLYGTSALTGSSEQSYAAFLTGGGLGSFMGATGVHTILGSGGYNFYNHAGGLYVDASGKPHVIVLGGADVNTGAPVAGVWVQHD